MLSPWLELLAKRPQLLAAHASAWVDLLAAEGGAALADWLRGLWLKLAAALAAALGLGLAAVALMLWAVTPASQLQQPGVVWVLLLVPMLPWAVAVACWIVGRRQTDGGSQVRFARLAQQWQADVMLLRPDGARQ